MAYTINRFDGSTLTVVQDGTVDSNTDIKLVGKNYAGYGEIQNENFVFLLENFASLNPPPRPISGQIWFDSDTSKLKFYDGNKFRTTGGAEISAETPSGLTEGDFWWDTENEQLYAYNGNDFILVGPQDAGEGITQMQSRSVQGTDGVTRSVITSVINDQIVHIISNQNFTIAPNPENTIEGFDVIKRGITLRNTLGTSGGVTSTDHVFWGTASNSNKLGGVDASQFVQTGEATFNSQVDFSDNGFAVGDSNDLIVRVEDDLGIISNEVGNRINFRAKNNQGDIKSALFIESNAILPGSSEEITIGTSENPFDQVFANNFSGIADRASALEVNGDSRFGDISATSNTVAVRDSSGDLRANLFRGTALQAKYADLAEIYSTPGNLRVGTVVSVCDHNDHEVCDCENLNMIIGVVSENPAYLMNSEAIGQAIAFTGRVPVRVKGKVKKGNKVRAIGNGVASSQGPGDIVGIALESSDQEEEKLIECVLQV